MGIYERKARLIPGLMGIGAITATLATLGVREYPAVTAVLALASVVGGGYLLSVLVANLGRSAQTALWEDWGGRPTTQLLRTRQPADNPTQREVWRQALSKHTGVRLLNEPQEASEPSAADQAIEASVNQVLHFGQDERFPILLSENAQYGLERNLYGFRWAGRITAAVCIGCLLATLAWTEVSPRLVIAGLVIDFAFLLAWFFIPSVTRVKAAGFRYATQLMHTVVRAEQLRQLDHDK